jgi:hypothetical protein
MKFTFSEWEMWRRITQIFASLPVMQLTEEDWRYRSKESSVFPVASYASGVVLYPNELGVDISVPARLVLEVEKSNESYPETDD